MFLILLLLLLLLLLLIIIILSASLKLRPRDAVEICRLSFDYFYYKIVDILACGVSITEVNEVVSWWRLDVERPATAVSCHGATSGPRTCWAASSGDLLQGPLSSDVVATLPRRKRQPPFAAKGRAASRLAQGHFRVPLHLSQPVGIAKTSGGAE